MLDTLNKQYKNEELRSEIEELLQKYGKTIYTDKGECKPLMEVLYMLSEIWKREGSL